MSDRDTGAAAAAPTLPALADAIRLELAAAETGQRRALEHALRAGELLVQAKAQLGHGEWMPWLAANFPGSQATAKRYVQLAANRSRVSDLGSVREALAEVARINRETKPPRRERPPGARPTAKVPAGVTLWENEDVIAWATKRLRAGRAVDEMRRDSQAGLHGWPLPGQELGQNASEKVAAVVRDRQRRDAQPTKTTRPTNPGGKTNATLLREAKKRAAQTKVGTPGELARLQLAIARLCGVLEDYRPDEYEFDLVELSMVDAIHDDLVSLGVWHDRALSSTQRWLADGDVRARIARLRDTSGREPAEAEAFLRYADKLERKLEARLLA